MKETIIAKIIQDNEKINNLTQKISQEDRLINESQDVAQRQVLLSSRDSLIRELQDNSGDKKRSEIIKDIENFTGRRLLTYFSINGMISDRDAHIIEDFLISNNLKQIDILINSPGGYTDASEKMIKICQTRTSNNNNFDFRTIVAQQAKSAAILFALGSKKILLCECAELGPVDPQILVHAPNGEKMRDSAHQIYYGSEQYRKSRKFLWFFKKNSDADLVLLSKYDPVAIKRAEVAIKHTEDIITKRIYTNPNIKKDYIGEEKIKEELKIFTDHNASYSHGRPIYYEDIRDFQYCNNKFIQKFNDYFISDENKTTEETIVVEKKIHELVVRSLEVVRRDTEPIKDDLGKIIGFNKIALKLFESSSGLVLTRDIIG